MPVTSFGEASTPVSSSPPSRISSSAASVFKETSPALLNLERVYEQNRQRSQKRNGTITAAKQSEPALQAPPPPPKGKPRLLLMGQRASFMDFQVWDFPGQIDYLEDSSIDMNAIFGEVGALIWVIDSQDDYLEAVARLNITILSVLRNYPNIKIEVFIHKVDGLSDDFKMEIHRDIIIRVQDELSDHGFENAPVNFHLTSIYDHSIFEAFSKVIQKLVPRLGQLEAMLTSLCRTCRFEKVYLFDVLSKIYIATDSTPAEMASYEVCSDFIDGIIDIIEVYGSWPRPDAYNQRLEAEQHQPLADQIACPWAESCIVLADGSKPILLREVDKHLALVAVMQEGSYDKIPLINMNVDVVVKGLTEFFKITKHKK
ncbi:MAG: GTP-binding protein gtr2 [Sporothrix epigloea]